MVGIAFEPGNPRAAATAERLTHRFVELYGDPEGKLIQAIISDGSASG